MRGDPEAEAKALVAIFEDAMIAWRFAEPRGHMAINAIKRVGEARQSIVDAILNGVNKNER